MKKKVRHVKILARCGMLRHAAACFKTPTNSSQNLALRHAAACCGMLLPLVLARKWAEMLPNPCILRGPQQRGQNFRAPSARPYV